MIHDLGITTEVRITGRVAWLAHDQTAWGQYGPSATRPRPERPLPHSPLVEGDVEGPDRVDVPHGDERALLCCGWHIQPAGPKG
jgi:hypothetical protein